jgi:acyl carrier protein
MNTIPANQTDLKARVLEVLLNVAPDIDIAKLQPSVRFRDQFDFDSMDTLSFAISLHGAFGITVPETDYRQLASLDSTVTYVGAHLTKTG